MSEALKNRLFEELEQLPLIDPHTHINPLSAASENLADIMGYHYYTELAHSAGLPREVIEEPGISPKEKVARLIPKLETLENTAQYAWLIDICREFFDFQGERLTVNNWESLYDLAGEKMATADWEQQVLSHSRLDQVYLTNDFDDPLAGFDTSFYVPCLRTDDLVFHLQKPAVRERFFKATGFAAEAVLPLRQGIQKLFAHFLNHGARACAISLPPDFTPQPVDDAMADSLFLNIRQGSPLSLVDAASLSQFVFWELAKNCAEHQLPFDLMIGVNRGVYRHGVYQGLDLYDRRTSLIQYKELFNRFPQVKFPISVLTHNSNQELVSYAWIFPNVIANGHWWYSNTPPFIEPDLRSRITAIPQTKYIGYYSDMYKLEFALPKFRMYRRILAKVLAEDFVIEQKWSETKALELGRRILRTNVEELFGAA